jgi:hypothetical protein
VCYDYLAPMGPERAEALDINIAGNALTQLR